MNFTTLVAEQRAFFQTGATRTLAFRSAQLRKLQQALETFESALLDALHQDLRKSPHEAYTSEVGLVQSEIRHALRHLAAWMKPQRRPSPWLVWPARSAIHRDPFGVALILGPWNYPVQLLLAPLVGALAAGNCAVLKPSEFAPRTSAVLGTLIQAAFASNHVAVVEGEREVAEALLREKFDTIFFTGSTPVGKAVMRAAAEHLTPVTLELGGKSPCLVCADAPVETTARRIVWGKFLNAGQTCVAPDYVLVDRPLAEPLLEALRTTIRAFFGDDPRQSPDLGRIVNRKHFDRLKAYLNHGRVVHGGEWEESDLYMAPTVLADVPADSPIMREEIFGPILPVLEVAGLDEALAFLRPRPTPLALYLFTRDRAVQDRVLAETRSGGVAINDTLTHIIGPDLPFGGLGESGMGAYHGKATFDCFSSPRSVLRRSLTFDPTMRYPPQKYSLTTLKRLFRLFMGR